MTVMFILSMLGVFAIGLLIAWLLWKVFDKPKPERPFTDGDLFTDNNLEK